VSPPARNNVWFVIVGRHLRTRASGIFFSTLGPFELDESNFYMHSPCADSNLNRVRNVLSCMALLSAALGSPSLCSAD